MGKYAYTASPGKTSDDKFEVEKLKKGEAEFRDSDVPDRKAMRYIQNDSLSEFLNPKAGAGRGRVNPKKGKDYAKGGQIKGYRDGGIYTADMGQPPQDIDGGSAPLKKPMPKKPEDKKPATKLRGEGTRKIPVPPKKEKMYAKGGSIDGIAQSGKTNCKMR